MASAGRELPKCKYGSLCYRKNDDHRKEFWHPGDESKARSNREREQEAEFRLKDGGTNSFSLQSSLGRTTPTNLVDEESEGAVEGEWELDTYNGLKEEDSDDTGQEATAVADAKPIIALSTKKLDGLVLLILVGVPGSGKSTFCSRLMSSAAQPWTRICQDIIAKGKRGTKKQCLKHAEHALAEGHSVLIDRCNIDKIQRLEFLQLAKSVGAEAHAVVLNLPASVCIDRASKRVGHEGGLHVGNAGPIVNHVFRRRQMPSLMEGFSRITFCRTDIDTDEAVQQYRKLRPGMLLESGVFGATLSKKSNVLHGIGSNQHIDSNVINNNVQENERSKGKLQVKQIVSNGQSEIVQETGLSRRSELNNTGDLPGGAYGEEQGPNTLAFPSISTSDFQFDHEKASSVIVNAVSEFLLKSKNTKLRLVMVDLTSDSHILSLVRRKALEKGLDSRRFLSFVGDITKLRSSGGPTCNIIANAANWRLKAGGGGVNAAIFKAAGPELEKATKEVAQTLQPGTSVIVQLPASSPLHKQGVTHIIHVLGPNMNPQRPNCLLGDYSEGCRILYSAYASMFQNFSSAVQGNSLSESSNEGTAEVGIITQKPMRNAFTVLMQASKRKLEVKDSNSRREKVSATEEAAARVSRDIIGPQNLGFPQRSGSEESNLQNQLSFNLSGPSTAGSLRAVAPKDETDVEKQGLRIGASGNQGIANIKRKWDGWALALYNIALNPEQHKDSVLQVTDDAVVVQDLYPKAKKHILVVARRHGLDSLEDVKKENSPLLRCIHSLGETWAACFLKEDPSLIFRIGYHSIPSLRQLHLHVISQDFDSASMKKKKHWNSFTSPFFLDSLDVLDELDRSGQVQIRVKDAEDFLEDLELRCHRCRSAHPNMPRLKQHISSCRRPQANVKSVHLITLESLPFD